MRRRTTNRQDNKPMKKTIIALLLALISTSAGAQLNTNRIMQIGRNALYFEDYVLSIQYFNRVINVKPYLAEPYYYRAVAKFYLDDLSGTASDCDIALSINPFLIGAYNLRGIVRLRQGKSADALSDFQAGLQYEPNNMNLLLNSGIANINLKEYEQAIADYDKLLEHDQKNVPAILYRGIALVEHGDTITALGEFKKATEINKYSPDAYTYSGMLHYQMHKYEEALDDYNHLQELRPHDANVYVNRAITKYNLDDYKGCFADLDEAIRLDPKNKMAYANRGMLRNEVGDYNNALEDFTHVLAIDASDDIALFNRAITYIQVGEMNNALSDLNIIIAKHPDFGPAYYQRAIVKRYMNDQKGSEIDYMTAYTFEQERIKRGLENGERAARGEDTSTDKDAKEKKESRSKNDNDIKKYDQMVVVSDFGDNDEKLSQDTEHIRGRVQDRDIAIDLEPVFELSFFVTDTVMPKARYYEKSVEQFNNNKVYSRPLMITNREYSGEGNESLFYFNQIRETTTRIEQTPAEYDLYLVRGTLYNTVMNYNNAINDFNVCILKNPYDVNALFNRAATRYKMVEVIRSMENEAVAIGEPQMGAAAANNLRSELSILDFDLIMADLRQVIQYAPDFEFAYYNMSLINCARKQFKEATEMLDKAISLNPEFAEAYFNRGIINIYLGNDKAGEEDLSKAGELGIHKAYNVIKRYTGKTKEGNEKDH